MSYKVLLNNTDKNDCYLCIFGDKCRAKCPLIDGWYFGSSRSKKTDIVDVWDAE